MRLFMSVDLEGFAGISFWHEAEAGSAAAAEGIKSANVQLGMLCEALKNRYTDLEIITICDSHSMGTNIFWRDLPEYTELIRGFPRRYYMMEGLDESYHGVVFAGYHAGAGRRGNMDHTYSATLIHKIFVNGREVNELEINSLFAGEFGVPVIMAAGGDLFVKEALDFDSTITGCILKKEFGKYSGKSYSLERTGKLISQAAADLKKTKDYNVHKVNGNIKLNVEFRDTVYAEVASLIPCSLRKGRNVTVSCRNAKEMYELLMLMIFAAGKAAQIR